ncbi:MAG: HYR domain-containing protein [Flavobacteriales bacterium]
MKHFYIFSFALLSFYQSHAQVTFWTEDFGSGCGGDTQAAGYATGNGTWNVTDTGFNEPTGNVWYASAMENGNAAGQCGTGCGNDRSLHVSSHPDVVGDLGAAYYEGFGGLCDILPCGASDRRAESPAISCVGYTSVTLEFVYMEGGNALDNASLWYYNGTTWSQLIDLPKTALTCSPQGIWTAYSIALPVTANNNANVKIGFRWTSNDDGDATDPSFAVDDITLEGLMGTDNTPPTINCPGDMVIEVEYSTDCAAYLINYTSDAVVDDDTDPFPLITQNPPVGTFVDGLQPVTLTATDASGNSASCSFNVYTIDDEGPIVQCPDDITITAAEGDNEAYVAVPDLVADDCNELNGITNDYNNTGFASDTYPVGTTVVEFTVFDEFGNSSTCTTNITVLPFEIEDCCPADFNCDGVVSVLDLIIIIGEFGCTGSACITDLDDNDVVGATDMNIFISLYGNICN